MVTGKEQQVELNLTEEEAHATAGQEVPDPLDEKAMVVTSAEALVELNLDLVDDALTFFESTPREHSKLISVTLYCLHYVLFYFVLYCLESPTVSTLTATEEEMLTDGEYSTAKYMSGVVTNVIFSNI